MDFLLYFGAFWNFFKCTFHKKRYLNKKIGIFLGALLGAFDKYVEIMCYFREFLNVLVAFGRVLGHFLTNFENSKEIPCYFLKTLNLGDLPKFGSRLHLCFQVVSTRYDHIEESKSFMSQHLLDTVSNMYFSPVKN